MTCCEGRDQWCSHWLFSGMQTKAASIPSKQQRAAIFQCQLMLYFIKVNMPWCVGVPVVAPWLCCVVTIVILAQLRTFSSICWYTLHD